MLNSIHLSLQIFHTKTDMHYVKWNNFKPFSSVWMIGFDIDWHQMLCELILINQGKGIHLASSEKSQ